jgi:hypothetical protein
MIWATSSTPMSLVQVSAVVSRACFLHRQIVCQMVFIPVLIVVLCSGIELYSHTSGATPLYNHNNTIASSI